MPTLIAITGGSGSGKTTLARALAARLGPQRAGLFVEDNYYRPRAGHAVDMTGRTPAEVEALVDFDDPSSKDMALLAAHLAALKAGEPVDQPVYDFAAHDRAAGVTARLEPRPVIVAEGVHLLHPPELRALFDLTVYVDADADLRLARRILRDVAERGRTAEGAIRQYLRFVRASHRRYTEPTRAICDIVVNDDLGAASLDAPNAAALEAQLAPVLSWLAARSFVG